MAQNNDSEQGIDFSLVIASSVHDMKNSVGMLLASLESVIAGSPPDNPEMAKHFSTLHYEASRINGELIELLTIYRMSQDFLPIRIDGHFVVDILEEQIARNHVLMQTGGVSFEMDCDPNMSWYFDHDLVGSVIHNVIVNCVRYTKNRIAICAEMENDYLKLSIADNGEGYPNEMLVNPGHFVEATEINSGSTNLGLYFAEKIAAYHKQDNRVGYIKLSNGGPLGGGVFSIFLP
ncbi:MAG: HAMP domain-containing histidine kinase [Cellvibrionaceae bacterium]|nr:HAMP domain-containing histidine kinase [Cellvibrionaceae bacterium]